MSTQMSFLTIWKNEKIGHLIESVRKVSITVSDWLKGYFEIQYKRVSNLEQLCKIAKYTVLPRKIGEDRQPEQIMNYFDGAKVCTPGKCHNLRTTYLKHWWNYLKIQRDRVRSLSQHYFKLNSNLILMTNLQGKDHRFLYFKKLESSDLSKAKSILKSWLFAIRFIGFTQYGFQVSAHYLKGSPTISTNLKPLRQSGIHFSKSEIPVGENF